MNLDVFIKEVINKARTNLEATIPLTLIMKEDTGDETNISNNRSNCRTYL